MRSFSKIGALGHRLQQTRPRLTRGISQTLADPTAWNQAPAIVTTLPNGVRVATRETFSEVSSVGVYINAGTRDETAATAGASKMVEALALTGTKKRPKAQLESEIESMGAALSMTSGREQTAYTMSVMNSDIKQGVDILGDLVTSTGVANLAKEKAGLIRSLNEADTDIKTVVSDRLHVCAFRDGTLGLPTTGPFDGAESLSEAQLMSYVNSTYTAENMVIAATGAVKHEELVKLAAGAFGGVKAGTTTYGEKPYFCGAELLYRNDEMGPTAYIAVGWEAVPWKSPDAVTFMVMQSIIGSYKKNAGLVPGVLSGNRVINAVANKMDVGCADEFEAFTHFYKDTGIFGFYVACDEVAVEHAIGELMFGCNLLSFSVTDEEVARGKRELQVALTSASQTADAQCAKLGEEVLAYGRGIPLAEMILRIEAVDTEEVKRVAWKYLADQEVAVTGLGPLHGMPQYYDLRRSTNMHRY
jgi:processing peptidase subunit beta